MIIYRNDLSNITSEQLKGFFVGWPNPPKEDKHLELLRNSAYIWLAIDDTTNNVIGFVNANSDEVLSAYIPLLEVLPEYQGLGVGKELMKKMLYTLSKFYMVDLLCDKDMTKFYDQFDMFQATGMIIRNYDRQNGE